MVETVDLEELKLWNKLGAIQTLWKLRGKLDRNVTVKGSVALDVQAQAEANARSKTTAERRSLNSETSEPGIEGRGRQEGLGVGSGSV